MATNDTKYTSYLDIAQRIARAHPNKSANTNPLDIAAWCAECETEFCGDIESYRTYVDVPLTVNDNRQVLLPCNLYKIQDVFAVIGDNSSRITYSNNGVYLSFSSDQTFPTNDDGNSIVYMNYKGIAIDTDTGYPLIKKGHEYACEAYCLTKIYLEDYLSGKMGIAQWNELQAQLSNALATVRRPGKMDNQKMLEIQHIKTNLIQKPYELPLYNMNY